MEFIPAAKFEPLPTVENAPSHISQPHGTIFEPEITNEETDFFPPIEVVTPKPVSFNVQVFSHVVGALGVALFVVLTIAVIRKKCPGEKVLLLNYQKKDVLKVHISSFVIVFSKTRSKLDSNIEDQTETSDELVLY